MFNCFRNCYPNIHSTVKAQKKDGYLFKVIKYLKIEDNHIFNFEKTYHKFIYSIHKISKTLVKIVRFKDDAYSFFIHTSILLNILYS